MDKESTCCGFDVFSRVGYTRTERSLLITIILQYWEFDSSFGAAFSHTTKLAVMGCRFCFSVVTKGLVFSSIRLFVGKGHVVKH